MNVRRQQISGWVYLVDEHRTVMLNNRGPLQPITLNNADDKQHRDIVITRVSENNVVGYVLTPNAGGTVGTADQN